MFVGSLATKVANYDPAAIVALASKNNSVAAVKVYIEANGLGDAGVYPSFLPVFGSVLLVWLQKAIAARDAAIACSTEVDKVPLEVVA